jgi:hypothetical protein
LTDPYFALWKIGILKYRRNIIMSSDEINPNIESLDTLLQFSEQPSVLQCIDKTNDDIKLQWIEKTPITRLDTCIIVCPPPQHSERKYACVWAVNPNDFGSNSNFLFSISNKSLDRMRQIPDILYQSNSKNEESKDNNAQNDKSKSNNNLSKKKKINFNPLSNYKTFDYSNFYFKPLFWVLEPEHDPFIVHLFIKELQHRNKTEDYQQLVDEYINLFKSEMLVKNIIKLSQEFGVKMEVSIFKKLVDSFSSGHISIPYPNLFLFLECLSKICKSIRFTFVGSCGGFNKKHLEFISENEAEILIFLFFLKHSKQKKGLEKICHEFKKIPNYREFWENHLKNFAMKILQNCNLLYFLNREEYDGVEIITKEMDFSIYM